MPCTSPSILLFQQYPPSNPSGDPAHIPYRVAFKYSNDVSVHLVFVRALGSVTCVTLPNLFTSDHFAVHLAWAVKALIVGVDLLKMYTSPNDGCG